jgi:hypothetical protein
MCLCLTLALLAFGSVLPATAHAAIRSDGTNMQHLAAPANDSPVSGTVTILQWDVLNVDHNAAKLLFQFH